MFNLKLEASVEPVHPPRTIDVHSRSELEMPPLTVHVVGFVRVAGECLHVEVREGDLDV